MAELPLDEDLRALPAAVAQQAQAMRNAGAKVKPWEAHTPARQFCEVSGCADPALSVLFDALLAMPGWGRYSKAVAVWGWYQ